jgi:hypothetical protein
VFISLWYKKIYADLTTFFTLGGSKNVYGGSKAIPKIAFLASLPKKFFDKTSKNSHLRHLQPDGWPLKAKSKK